MNQNLTLKDKMNREKKRKIGILSVIAAVFVFCAGFMAYAAITGDAVAAYGTSGTVTWTLYDDGTMVFEPTYGDSGTLSAYTNASAVPWFEYAEQIEKIESTGAVSAGTSLAYYFAYCRNLTDLGGLADWDTSDLTSLSNTFFMCTSLSDISPVSDWDISNVTTLYGTFWWTAIEDTDALSGWDISMVETLNHTFCACLNLTDLSGLALWDTSRVTNLYMTFCNCDSLEDITALGNWDVSKVTTFYSLFNFTDITSTDAIADWDTSQVTVMDYCFQNCLNLRELNLSGWSTQSVVSRAGMFTATYNLVSATFGEDWDWYYGDERTSVPTGTATGCFETMPYDNLDDSSSSDQIRWEKGSLSYGSTDLAANWTSSMAGTWTWSAATELTGSISGTCGDYTWTLSADGTLCFVSGTSASAELGTYSSAQKVPWRAYSYYIKKVTISGSGSVYAGTNLNYYFLGCSNLKDLSGLSSLNTDNVTALIYTFSRCTGMTNVDFMSGWSLDNVTSLQSTFIGCKTLADLSGLENKFSGGKLTSLYQTFYACNSLEEVSAVGTWNLTNTASFYGTFRECRRLETLDGLENLTFANGTTLKYMLASCPNLTDLSACGTWDTAGVTDISRIFCYSFSVPGTSVLKDWDVSGVTDISYAFCDCCRMSYLDLSGWNLEAVTSWDHIFGGTTSLRSVTLGSGWYWPSSAVGTSTGTLETPPDFYTTGKWIREDEEGAAAYGALTPAELAAAYTTSAASDYAGTWVWDETDHYTVAFSANADDAEGYVADAVWAVEDNEEPVPENAFTRTGYTFKEWNTESDGSGTGYNPGDVVTEALADADSSAILYAKWSANMYTIRFDSGSGTGEMEEISASYGTELTLPECTFEAASSVYVFTGWNTEKDGSGISYSDGASVSNLTAEANGEVTLYAQWAQRSYVSEYVSYSNIYDPDNERYQTEDEETGEISGWLSLLDEDGNLMSAEEAFPSDTYSGYWTRVTDDTWTYTFYVYDASLTYYVWEEALTSEELSGFSGDYTELDPYCLEDGSVSATITNSDTDTGDLTVTKMFLLTDGTDYDGTDEVKITVTLFDGEGNQLTGTVKYGEMIFVDGLYTNYFGDNDTVTAADIPVGYSYKVTEYLDSDQDDLYEVSFTKTVNGSETSYTDSVSGSISADLTDEIVVKNYGYGTETGSFRIRKTVTDGTGEEISSDDVFTIRITLTDEDGNPVTGTYGGYAFADGVCETTIRANQTIKITNVPVGYQYVVTETDSGDYTVSYEGETGTVSGTAKIVTITNTEGETPASGSLTVAKYVTADDGEAEYAGKESFDVVVKITDADDEELDGSSNFGGYYFKDGVYEFSLTNGESITFTEIPVGYHYTVTENLTDDQNEIYTVTYSGDVAEAGETGTITGENTVNITNTYTPEDFLYGDITLKKLVTGWYASDENLYTFSISLQNLEAGYSYEIVYYDSDENEIDAHDGSADAVNASSAGSDDLIILLADGESAVIRSLPTGTSYQICEQAGDYTAAYEIVDDSLLGGSAVLQSSGGNTRSNVSLSTARETLDCDGDETENVTVLFTNTIDETTDVSLSKQSLLYDGTEDETDTTEYEIIACFSDLEPDGEYNYTDGEKTYQLYADADGAASVSVTIQSGQTYTFEGLPIGSYYWFEETANSRLASYTVTDALELGLAACETGSNESNYESLATQVETADAQEEITVIFYNRSTDTAIQIYKLADNTGEYLEGAVYELYRINGAVDERYDTSTDSSGSDDADEGEDGQILSYETEEISGDEEVYEEDEEDTFIGTFTTDEKGYSVIMSGIEAGEYYFIEVQAPDGYLINEDPVLVTVTEDDIASGITVQVELTDEPIPASVKIGKTNAAGKLCGGASFDLYLISDTEDPGEDIYITSVTTEEDEDSDNFGYSEWIEGLTEGEYYFVETQAPDGLMITVTEDSYGRTYAVRFTIDESNLGTAFSVLAADNALMVLASTGGPGIFLYVLASAAVIGLGICVFTRKRRIAG